MEPCRCNGRVPLISRLETRYLVRPPPVGDDRTDDCACGAMILLYGLEFRKLRFQMIADIVPRGGRQARNICREALLLWAWRGESCAHKTILHQNVTFVTQ